MIMQYELYVLRAALKQSIDTSNGELVRVEERSSEGSVDLYLLV